MVDKVAAGEPCEFLYDGRWYRAISNGIQTTVAEGIQTDELALKEVRGTCTTFMKLDSVSELIAPKGTHLEWSAADERKVAAIGDRDRSKRPRASDATAEKAKKPTLPAPKSLTTIQEVLDVRVGEDVDANALGSSRRPSRRAAVRGSRAMRAVAVELSRNSADDLSSDDDNLHTKVKKVAAKPKRERAVKRAPEEERDDECGKDEEDADADSQDDDDEDDEDDEAYDAGRGRSKRQPKAKKAGRGRQGDAKPRVTVNEGKWLGPKPRPAPAGRISPARMDIKAPPAQSVQPYVDAAGLDIEDRGVEWIVEKQCAAARAPQAVPSLARTQPPPVP